MNTMQKAARQGALALMDAARVKNASLKGRPWPKHEKQQWVKAFNALQRLAGKKIVYRDGGFVVD